MENTDTAKTETTSLPDPLGGLTLGDPLGGIEMPDPLGGINLGDLAAIGLGDVARTQLADLQGHMAGLFSTDLLQDQAAAAQKAFEAAGVAAGVAHMAQAILNQNDALTARIHEIIAKRDAEVSAERGRYLADAAEVWPLVAAALDAGDVRTRDGETAPGAAWVTSRLWHDVAETLSADQMDGSAPLDTIEQMAEALRAAYAYCDPADLAAATEPQGTPEPVEVELARQDTAPTLTHYTPHSKAAQLFAHPGLWAPEGLDIDAAGRAEQRRGADIVTHMALTWADDADEWMQGHGMSHFDAHVHWALSTLWAAGNRSITPTQVYRALSQTKDGKPTKSWTEKIRESIARQMATVIYVDYTAEMRRRTHAKVGADQITEFKLQRNLICATGCRMVTASGRESVGWKLLARPALYEQAAALQQVVTYPQGIAAPTEGQNNSPRTAMIRSNVADRICAKRRNTGPIIIKLTWIAEHSDMDPERLTRKQVQLIRDQTKELLDRMQRDNDIKSWTETKRGRGMNTWVYTIDR